jgi:hypothetical protein
VYTAATFGIQTVVWRFLLGLCDISNVDEQTVIRTIQTPALNPSSPLEKAKRLFDSLVGYEL